MTAADRLSLPFDTGQIEVPKTGSILLLRPPGVPEIAALPKARLVCVQGFRPATGKLEQAGLVVADALPAEVCLAIVYLTRSRDENRANTATAFAALRKGGTLVVDGAKTDGVDSLFKAIRKLVPISGSLPKAHGRVFWLSKAETPVEFAKWASALTPQKNADGYWSVAGIFSAGKIDGGSAALAPFLTGNLSGRGADLGAGWGWLSEQALNGNPDITALDLIEAEKAALACARLNVTAPAAAFHWQDATSLALGGDYDFIIMNPPFHPTRRADTSLGRQFIRSAARLLGPKGTLYMVANRQLAYEATLDASFGTWQMLSQSAGYKCVRARRPK